MTEESLADYITRLEQENKTLNNSLKDFQYSDEQHLLKVIELEQENKSLYEEKNCLHKIIDRLLENAGYSKDIASAEDFEDVYEDMQIKRNELIELKQENKELKEWKDKVVKLFESACRCKYLNEETDICSYTNEKCININKCVYKYQELNSNYRSALEEIREIEKLAYYPKGMPEEPLSQRDFILHAINDYEQRRIKILTKINEVLNENTAN